MIDELAKELETEAIEHVRELRAYRTYQGKDVDRLQRAKVALGLIGSYVRLRATLANERTNELVALRMERDAPLELAPKGTKQLSD